MTDGILVHTAKMGIRWGDMDALGHVNNVEYFRYMEQTRVEWLTLLGYGVTLQQAEGPILVNTTCQFKKPLHYPGVVLSEMYLEKLGNTSFTARHVIRLESDQQVYAEGTSVGVWVNTTTGQPIPLPQVIRDLV
jgi:acyl-CoA thioester hydrolase